MNKLLTLLFISISLVCFGQTDKPKPKDDTLRVNVNQLQLDALISVEKKMNEDNQKAIDSQIAHAHAIELLFGVKKEDIESMTFKNGQFKIILNQKSRPKRP